ncbi:MULTISPECIES: hypothetical protein [Morganellaceae]|uniref:hypothetical protein n=1 Tax=Morganellaceae TaxID=1903414 RepID=UPI002024730A|nr:MULTISPECIES: hypothetical protein [Morganellaceae]MCL8621845.1 hypothetical protein [Proteus mirabilis]MCL8632870.1 hypothetical protein [Proteus mirabilis]
MAINIEENEITNCDVGIQVTGTVSDANIRRNRIQSTRIAILGSGAAPVEIFDEFDPKTPVSKIDDMYKTYGQEKPQISDEESAKSFLSKFDLVKWIGVASTALSIIEKVKKLCE